MKIANIDTEILHIFWTTWGNSIKFSEKICFKIILKVTKNQGSTLCKEDAYFQKPQGRWGGEGVNLTPPSQIRFKWNDSRKQTLKYTSNKVFRENKSC